MPKLERLLELARMTREGRARSVREMSRVCGVSQRTIYRYLNTLTVLDLPGELHTDADPGSGETREDALNGDDRCLIRYVLDHNPLNRQAFFAGRIERLRRTLAPVPNTTGRRLRGPVLEVSLPRTTSAATASDKLLATFERACLGTSAVRVIAGNTDGKARVLRPEAIRLAGDTIQLRFRNPVTGRLVRMRLGDVVSIQTEADGSRRARRSSIPRKKG